MMSQEMSDQPVIVPLDLLLSQRTMTLATCDPLPWSAPVYFVFRKGQFYFFSSPKSRHITATTTAPCAASVFRDSDHWRDIEGVQMSGKVVHCDTNTEIGEVLQQYLHKFPAVRDFFGDAEVDPPAFLQKFRTQLYRFQPGELHYLNNRIGLSKRRLAELPKEEGAS